MAKNKDRPEHTSVLNITKHLQGVDFPASKQQLTDHAKKKGADDSAMKMFEEMDDVEYESVKDVMREFGKHYKKAA